MFFGRNPAIMALVKRHINSAGHQTEGFLEETAVARRLRSGDVALCVIGGGVESPAREQCKALCVELGIPMLEHFGGPDQLLKNIQTLLAEREA